MTDNVVPFPAKPIARVLPAPTTKPLVKQGFVAKQCAACGAWFVRPVLWRDRTRCQRCPTGGASA
jgi:hypothetical protein